VTPSTVAKTLERHSTRCLVDQLYSGVSVFFGDTSLVGQMAPSERTYIALYDYANWCAFNLRGGLIKAMQIMRPFRLGAVEALILSPI
jgi:hypothetical protein